MTILGKVIASFLGLVSLITGSGQSQQNVGASVPATPALVSDYLATAITNTATSMTLASGKYRDGTPLSGFMCFTIDVNSPQVEYVCGNASSTSVTGMSRGISYSNPNATSSLLAYAHNRLASVTITNYPESEFVNRKINGLDSIDNQLYYSSYVAPTSSLAVVPKQYVDNVVSAGAAPATESVPGIGILSTQSQMANGVATGTYNLVDYPLFVQNKFFSATPSATTTGVVTGVLGKIAQGFLDLTDGFIFSGGVTSTGNTSLATTTISKTLSVSATSSLATTTITGNLSVSGSISGNISYPSYIGQASFNDTNASSSRVISGLSFIPMKVRIVGGMSGGYSAGVGWSSGFANATSSQYSSRLMTGNSCAGAGNATAIFYTANLRNIAGNPCDATLTVSLTAIGTSSITLSESSQGSDAGTASYTYIIE